MTEQPRAAHPGKAAAAKAETKHEKQQRKQSEAADLDEALDDSFPASDPPSMTQPRNHAGAPKREGQTAPAAPRRQK